MDLARTFLTNYAILCTSIRNFSLKSFVYGNTFSSYNNTKNSGVSIYINMNNHWSS